VVCTVGDASKKRLADAERVAAGSRSTEVARVRTSCGEARGDYGDKAMKNRMVISPATATLSVVPSEDGKEWQGQLTWDNGRLDRTPRHRPR
jgi:hypothetical protein